MRFTHLKEDSYTVVDAEHDSKFMETDGGRVFSNYDVDIDSSRKWF